MRIELPCVHIPRQSRQGSQHHITHLAHDLLFDSSLCLRPFSRVILAISEKPITQLLVFSCSVCRQKLTYSCRRSIFGFLFGSVLASTAVYSYVLQEYRASNDLLIEDIYVGVFPLRYSTPTPNRNVLYMPSWNMYLLVRRSLLCEASTDL